MNKPKIGLALGGGGAKGVAHIPVLKTVDELKLNVSKITGTSIGAIMAVLYASGLSGEDIEQLYQQLFQQEVSFWRKLISRESTDVIKWYDLLAPGFGSNTGLVQIQEMLDFVVDATGVKKIEDLKTPVNIVAADFWQRQAVIFDSGDIKTALNASVALPGLFAPVRIGKQVLVDGGAVNPVPFDLLQNCCDISIAVNVLGQKSPSSDDEIMPSLFEGLFNTFQIMEESIVREKMRHYKPDIYLKPEITDVRILDFHKYDMIYHQAEPIIEQLKSALEVLLESRKQESFGKEVKKAIGNLLGRQS